MDGMHVLENGDAKCVSFVVFTVESPNIAQPLTLRIWCVNQISDNIVVSVLFCHLLHQQECTRLI